MGKGGTENIDMKEVLSVRDVKNDDGEEKKKGPQFEVNVQTSEEAKKSEQEAVDVEEEGQTKVLSEKELLSEVSEEGSEGVDMATAKDEQVDNEQVDGEPSG